MRSQKQRWFAAAGGVCGAAYLTANRLLPGMPGLLTGLLLGLGAALLFTGMLPKAAWRKLRTWKRRGE